MSGDFNCAFNLKKVKINLGGRVFDFIYGIGPHGLTPFENEISRHGVGEEFDIHLAGGALHETFGHLADILPIPHDDGRDTALRVSIESVSEAEPREVVRAMAELARCADHCCSC